VISKLIGHKNDYHSWKELVAISKNVKFGKDHDNHFFVLCLLQVLKLRDKPSLNYWTKEQGSLSAQPSKREVFGSARRLSSNPCSSVEL